MQGNTTENGPVVLPLLPSASAINVDGSPTTISNLTANATAIQALYNASNNASGNSTQASTAGTAGTAGNSSQAPSVTVTGFNPPLPWLAHFAFSEKVLTNATVPLLANATVNNTMGNMTGGMNSTAGNATGGNNASAGYSASTAANSQGNDLSGNAIGVQPYKWANITQLMNTLGNGNVTVVTTTRYTVNGSTSTTNITGGNNNVKESECVLLPVSVSCSQACSACTSYRSYCSNAFMLQSCCISSDCAMLCIRNCQQA